MHIGNWEFVGNTSLKKFFWFPRRLTNPWSKPIYRWGYWNFGKWR